MMGPELTQALVAMGAAGWVGAVLNHYRFRNMMVKDAERHRESIANEYADLVGRR